MFYAVAETGFLHPDNRLRLPYLHFLCAIANDFRASELAIELSLSLQSEIGGESFTE